ATSSTTSRSSRTPWPPWRRSWRPTTARVRSCVSTRSAGTPPAPARARPPAPRRGGGPGGRPPRLGLRLGDVDKYATELQNPELTEPSGSGDVPRRNYKLLAALAVAPGEVARAHTPAVVARHG